MSGITGFAVGSILGVLVGFMIGAVLGGDDDDD